MDRAEFERYEAKILSRERYTSDEEYLINVQRWLEYVIDGCERLKQRLQTPEYAGQYEEIQALLERRLVVVERLKRVVGEKQVA